MQASVSVNINASKEVIWQAITDIDQCQNYISSNTRVNVLERPENGVVGLKWREMFGKEAMETMWITDAQANES